MAKLIFKYGVMGSSKSADLITTAYNYRANGTKVEILKPAFDDRFGVGVVKSRAVTLSMKATALPNLQNYDIKRGTRVVLVDEVQFFSSADIDRLVWLADNKRNLLIICYGLMIDSNEHMFPASQRLQEVGAKMVLMELTCQMPHCMHRATHHLRFDANNNVIREGEQFALGDNQKEGPTHYKSVCRGHFNKIYQPKRLR